MFGIGGGELVLILLFAFLILGPEKLPDMAKTAGKAIARFRAARQDMNDTLKETGLVDARTGKPFTNPVDMVEKIAQVANDGKTQETFEKVAAGAASAAATATGASVKRDAAGQLQQESFAERKARYERERAAREAAQASAYASVEAAVQVDAAAQAETAVQVDAAAQADTVVEGNAAASRSQGGDESCQ